jgi:protein-L-isoaspartate(D-aspartate) O-methyltransferase
MLEQLELRAGLRVLGIGAGYNAALLGHLVGPGGHVVSVDIDDDIVEAAHERLADSGASNVAVVQGDGEVGYEPGAPYDGIVSTFGSITLTFDCEIDAAPVADVLAPHAGRQEVDLDPHVIPLATDTLGVRQ